MVLICKTSGVLLLQAAAFFTAVAARCRPVCSLDDPVLVLLNSGDAGIPFCSDFLGLPVSTVGATVTPTVLATVTETSYVTEVLTTIDGTVTVTVPVPARTTTVAPVKRDDSVPSVAYPDWLPSTYKASRISSACACLSIPLSIATDTATAEPVTITAPVTITETATSTIHETAIATETALPVPITRRTKIEILRKDTQANVGWLYYGNGPAIGTTEAQGATFSFTLDPSTTTNTQVRINFEGVTPAALGFSKENNPTNNVELEDSYGSVSNLAGTPPGSRPVLGGTNGFGKYETDIWTINTETRMISWQWIATSGALPTIYMYRVGGRLYAVGNVNAYNSATGGVSSQKYEVILRYSVVVM
ncbi:hypothetical protein B0H63DRAFT_564045 [Podospora didyma]|uniref:Uncharacterized protein n=1 Tax=Podospora didyma TaxID=330526 RepID=A0AAE0K9Q5_9PEZI|nr:hypothetical protein B0H63DRAFT_564045 [Podospora didyma]